jgi:hypothetical protein
MLIMDKFVSDKTKFETLNVKYAGKYFKYIAKNFDLIYLVYIEKIFLSKDEKTLFSGILVTIGKNEITIKKSEFNQVWIDKLEFIETSKKGYEDGIIKFLHKNFFINENLEENNIEK